MQLSHTPEESHGAPGTPPSVHTVVWTAGHDTSGHTTAGLLQLTSHAHELVQSIDGHAFAPEQLISHDPGPQVILPHEPVLEQSIRQS